MTKNALGEMQQQQLPLAFIRGEAFINKPQDLFIPPDALEVILETFEGPLDLLLYLIKKQKFDILDLPIAPITSQYMHYVDLMKNVKIELAAEYLVMAAILAEIKSRLLLPKIHIEDEEVDPRAELVRRLQEYEVIKQAAQEIDKIPRMERDLLAVNTKLPDNIPMRNNDSDVDLMELVSALQDVLKRTQAYEHHHIAQESLSTRERMSHILTILEQQKDNEGFIAFEQLFAPKEGRNGVVVTFLAILELLKDHLIECIQTSDFGRINVRASG